MKTLARCVAVFLFLLMIVGQVVSLGLREGWDVVAFGAVFIGVLFASLWYGYLADED